MYIAVPANLYKKNDIKVDVLYNISPKVIKTALSVLHFCIEFAVLIMMATGFRTWITMVGSGKLPASRFTNVMYYGVIGVGVILGLIEMVCELVDLFVKKDPERRPAGVREKTILEMLEEDRVAKLNAEAEGAGTKEEEK